MSDKELVESAIEDYIQDLQQRFTDERTRGPRSTLDIDGFFRLVGNAIKRQQEFEGVKTLIKYTEEMPEIDDNLKIEHITYQILNRKPGTFEAATAGQIMNGAAIRARRFMPREMIDDPDNPGYVIWTYTQPYDNEVEFRIYAQTNRTANLRAMWFEDLIERWLWYFRASGVNQILYKERGADIHTSPDNRKLVCRPMRYLVRTEKLTLIRENALRSLIIDSST